MKQIFEGLVLALVLVGHALLSDALTTAFTVKESQSGHSATVANAQQSGTLTGAPSGKQATSAFPWPLSAYPQQSAEVVSGLLAVLAFGAFLANETGLRRFRVLRRKILMPVPGKYEGYWASTCRRDSAINKESKSDNSESLRLSLSKIYYSKSRECWIHHGYEFEQNGKCIGEFKVESMYYSKPRGLWFFRGSTWDHEKGEEELYSERLAEKDQLSFISVAEKVENHVVSRYLDDPIAAGKSMQQSGRAAMVRLSQEKMKGWFPNFKGAIDHPSIRSDMAGVIDEIRNHLKERVSRHGEGGASPAIAQT